MDKKVPVIVFLAILAIAGGYFTYKFYTDNQALTENVASLEGEKKSLQGKNKKLTADLDEANRRAQEIQNRLSAVSEQLDTVERERDKLNGMYQSVMNEREQLFTALQDMQKELQESQQRAAQASVVVQEKQSPSVKTGSDEYWEDVVRRKAELETEKEELATQLRSKELECKELDNKSKNLELQLNDLERVKREMETAIKFKERTMAILTKDLVKEREDRKTVLVEIDKLKTENIALVREHKFLTRIQDELENKLKRSLDDKDILGRKVDEIETVLKDKALDIDSLQKQLTRSISSAKDVMPQEAKAVALPPIVVKADNKPSAAVSTLAGRVMAVNEKERFVIVDLGSANGVKPGDNFRIVQGGNMIASLQVIETRKDISACDIKEASPSIRIKEGDTVKLEG